MAQANPMSLVVGSSSRLGFVVAEQDTARAVGSGSLPVLGTPVALAWCEAATCAAVRDHLAPGQTTVGTRVEISHRAPSAVGSEVLAHAELVTVEGRSLTFRVEVYDDRENLVADGTIMRALVDEERFLGRL